MALNLTQVLEDQIQTIQLNISHTSGDEPTCEKLHGRLIECVSLYASLIRDGYVQPKDGASGVGIDLQSVNGLQGEQFSNVL